MDPWDKSDVTFQAPFPFTIYGIDSCKNLDVAHKLNGLFIVQNFHQLLRWQKLYVWKFFNGEQSVYTRMRACVNTVLKLGLTLDFFRNAVSQTLLK